VSRGLPLGTSWHATRSGRGICVPAIAQGLMARPSRETPRLSVRRRPSSARRWLSLAACAHPTRLARGLQSVRCPVGHLGALELFMRERMRSFIALSLFASVAIAHSEPALACSGVSCSGGDLLPKDGKVPANAVAWMWKPSSGEPWGGDDAGAPEPSVRVFVEGDAGAELALEATELDWSLYRLTPTQAPEAGSTLRVEYTDTCPVRTEVFSVEVTAALPVPALLGTLDHTVQSGYLHIADSSASCTHPYYARYVDVELNANAELTAFGDVVSYSMLVDGQRFGSDEVIYDDQDEYDDDVVPRTLAAGPLGVGRERVFALCDDGNGRWPGQGGDIEGEGVEPGPHRIQMLGLLPDGTRILSDEIEVDLSCVDCGVDGGITACGDAGAPDPSVNPVGEAGAPTEPTDTDEPSDTDAPDASASHVPEREAGASAPTLKPVADNSDNDGCSFTLNARGSHPLGVGLGLLALAFGRRLRRRSSQNFKGS
jgi:hypothetical protein